jgi:molybdate transport system substrate-binding protein
MKSKNKLISIFIIGILSFSMTACSSSTNSSANTSTPKEDNQTPPVSLNISAAASLKNSLDQIKDLYLNENKNVTLTFNYGASGSLEQQIEQGANVDIFMSAAAKQIDDLDSKNLLIKETRKNLLENNIVLIVPKDSSLQISDFKDLTNDKINKIAIGEPKSVPAGQYGEEALTNMNLLDVIKSKEVYAKDVTTVLNWVETSNADAGIVYETDAKSSSKVKIVSTAPSDTHKAVVYPVSILKESKNIETSKKFLEFLSTSKSKEIFEKAGFKMSQK